MRKILYLLGKEGSDPSQGLLPLKMSPDHDVSVVLIQDAVGCSTVQGNHVYVLDEDAAARNTVPSFPMVSYQNILRMMWDADCIIAS